MTNPAAAPSSSAATRRGSEGEMMPLGTEGEIVPLGSEGGIEASPGASVPPRLLGLPAEGKADDAPLLGGGTTLFSPVVCARKVLRGNDTEGAMNMN